MKFKRFGAMLLALVMCTGVFSTTAFAYSDESAATPTTEKAETVETTPEKTEDQTSEEVPYTVTVDEDGTVVFSFNGEEWTYDAEETEDDSMGTGKVVTNGSRLNVRTGAGMNYESFVPARKLLWSALKVTGIRSLFPKSMVTFTATIWN